MPSVFSSLDSNSIKLHRKFFCGDSLQKYNKASWLNNNKMANLLFCFLNHLWNYQAKFNETLQEAALHNSLQNYNKASRLTNNNNKIADFLFCFNKHLLWNYLVKFNETLQEASLQNTTRHQDWPTTTSTTWLTCWLAVETFPLELSGQIQR